MTTNRLRFVLCGLFLVGCGDASAPDPTPTDDPVTPSASPAAPPASGRIVSTDTVADAPTMLYADHEDTPPAGRPATPADAARWHLARFASYYRLTPADVAQLELLDVHDTGRGGIVVRFLRRIDGIEVQGERVSVAMDRSLDVVAFTGYVTGDLPVAAKLGRVKDAFGLDAPRAVAAAMSDLAGVRLGTGDFDAPTDQPGGYRAMTLTAAGKARSSATTAEPARGKPVFIRTGPGSLTAAYYVEADLGDGTDGAPRLVAYHIAADDGRVLAKHDLVASEHTYRVYADSTGLKQPWDGPYGNTATPHPTATPDGFVPPAATAQLVSVTSIGDVVDPWLPAGATETLGNNVDAYLDLVAPDGFSAGTSDLRGSVSAPGVFDYFFDVTVGANANATQRQAAITQLFYNINWFHDWYYAAGFTEASGNAQFANFGRGGLENDGMRAEAQDFGGFNNANMQTPADGARPRMQMFLWTKPTALNVTVTAPGSLAGTYTSINTATWGPLNFSLSGEIVRANPVDACTPLVGDYVGKIVFVDRGGVAACNGFAGKAERVQAAGGIGIIIANVPTSVNPTIAPGMGGTPTVPITIGGVSMNLADGDLFRAALATGPATGSVLRQVQLLDGDLDNQIVAHEWGHYISNRLVFDAAGLQTNMARGLGEGWADFHGLLMTIRAEDALVPTNANWAGTFGMGSYGTMSDPQSYYYGIRRYPYSTDMTKNPLSFRYISDASGNPTVPPPNFNSTPSQVHATGENWATMLWECYAALLRDTLGSTPRLTFTQARDRMRDYVVAAYKMTPANPTLLEARDAVLLAAFLNDPADWQLFGAAFAKRGAGVRAVAPPRGENTNTPVLESFAWGAAVEQTGATLTDVAGGACAPDGILDNGESAQLKVTFKNIGNADVGALTAAVSSSTAGIAFPGGATLNIPAIPRGGSATATLSVTATGLPALTPIAITVATPDAGAGEATPVSYSFPGQADEAAGSSTTDTVERTGTVWSTTSSVTGPTPDMVWQRVSTSLTNRAWRARSATYAATVELQTPSFVVPTGNTLGLAFNHRYSFERDSVNNLNFDAGVIEYTTDNGVTWSDITTVATNPYNGTIATGNPLAGRTGFTGTSTGYPGFLARSINLGTSFGGRIVRLRFRVSADTAVASPGWEVDDIQITGASAPLFNGLIAQAAGCNHQPIANAGLNQSVGEFGPGPAFVPTTVTLDAGASFDPDGNTLSYNWTQVAGPAVTLSSSTVRFPTFTAPTITRAQGTAALIFQLVVSDGTINSAAKLVQVTETNVNRPPVANAGPNQNVEGGALVQLDGTASADPDADDAITFNWTQTSGPAVVLSSATSATPTFTAPTVGVPTPIGFQLTVNDGLLNASASVVITVAPDSLPPTANAGPDQSVLELALVTLDGTGSTDPDLDPITYAWSAPPGITLLNPTSATPTFFAPPVTSTPRELVFSLVVTDSTLLSSSPDTVTVIVRPTGVVWQNLVGVAATGEDLVKTAATEAWTAGASSVDTLVGDGFVEFTTAEANTAKTVGLSNGDTSASWNEIDFGFHLTPNGKISVRENGTNRGQVGSYVAGDRLRVQVTGSTVTYLKNGALLFTSTVAPTFPLLVDTSLFTPGATVNDVVVVRQTVDWQNAVGVAVSGNSLTKTAPSNTLWNAGASSTDALGGDGYAQFTVAETNTTRRFGLSNGDTNVNFTEIDYAIGLASNGVVQIVENGDVIGSFGAYSSGDVFRVVVTSGVVTYARNGTVFYTSLVAPTFPLLVDTSLRTSGSTINNVLLVAP
jgi:large repetitive protein